MKNLYDLLLQSAERFGERPALRFRPRYRTLQWTYGELRERATNVAAALAAEDIGPGDRVLLFGSNSPEWVAAFFGILARGAVVVPLNPQSPSGQIDRIVATAEPKLLLCSCRSLWSGTAIPRREMEHAASTKAEVPETPGLGTTREDLAEIVFTSGTTGVPKGVMLTHGNLLACIEALPEAVPVSPEDGVMSIVPLFHLYGQSAGMLYPLSEGCTLTYLPALSSRVVLGTLARTPVHYLVTVPEFLQTFMHRLEDRLAGWPDFLKRRLRGRIRRGISETLHTLVSGGAPLAAELEAKWRALGFDVLQGYGLTETSPMIAINSLHDHRPGSVGKPIRGVEVRIAEDGEILVRGPNVMAGYFKDDARTRESFEGDWFKTDDLGKCDEAGFLYVFGRKKYMILGPGGENVYPEDIEFELGCIPGVRDSAVVGLERGGRTVIHAVLLADDVDGDAAVDRANRHLAPHQRIMSWSFWPEADFPRSATRKVKKQDVIKRLDNEPEAKPAGNTKVTPLKRLVAQVTRSDPGTIDASSKLVSDLNLDSLLRIELVGRIEEEFNVALAENQITAQTTVEDLERLIEQGKGQTHVGEKYPRWSMAPWVCRLRPALQKAVFFALSPLGRLEVSGCEHLQELEGPVIFMANHLSYLDGPLAGRAIPDRFRSRLGMAAAIDPLYKYFWYLVPFAELVFNAYPLATSLTENIRPSLDYTGRLLDDGWNVLMFPEGRMNREGTLLQELKGGTGMLAVEMGVPIVPMLIRGTGEILPPDTYWPRRRGSISIRFGKPLHVASAMTYPGATEAVEKALRALIDNGTPSQPTD